MIYIYIYIYMYVCIYVCMYNETEEKTKTPFQDESPNKNYHLYYVHKQETF